LGPGLSLLLSGWQNLRSGAAADDKTVAQDKTTLAE
jgi:hypothetical protein